MRFRTIKFLLLALVLTMIFPNQKIKAQRWEDLNGCYPLPATALVYSWCPYGTGQLVIRCHCGYGACSPSMQGFCDAPNQQ